MLFGSRAWGQPRPDSDIDLCIVIDELERGERTEAIEIVAEVATETLSSLSPFVVSTDQLERYQAIEYRFAEDIVRKGVPL